MVYLRKAACVIISYVIIAYANYVCVWFTGYLQAGETKNLAGSETYACVSPSRYSPYASLARFRTKLTSSSPSLSPATIKQDSGSIVSLGSFTWREHFSAQIRFSTNAATGIRMQHRQLFFFTVAWTAERCAVFNNYPGYSNVTV
jgi:hypothetical protein